MATIRKICEVDAPADKVWDVFSDIGAVHTRLAPGFVVDTQLEEGARMVTFGNGMKAREVIIGVDPTLRRIAYSAATGRLKHHNASFEVIELSATRTRIVWTADALPDDIAASIVEPMMEQGTHVMQQTLSRLGR